MTVFYFSLYSLHLFFGYWFLYRTLKVLKAKSYFPNFLLIGFIFLYTLGCIAVFLFFGTSVLFFLWIYGFSLLVGGVERGFAIYKRKKFYIIILSFLNIVILKIQMGESFRASLIYATGRFTGHIRSQLEHLLQYIVLMHEPSPKSYSKSILDFVKGLQFAEKNPHRALETLRHYHSSLIFTNNLKQKYIDVLYQVYAQTIIMVFLFLCLLSYVLHNYSFSKHVFLISLAIILFIVGVIFVLIYGKKLKWNF